MLRLNRQVFDEIITGTATTWYTSAADNALVASIDSYTIFAVATNVSGTSPSVNVYVDQSCDNQTWILGGTPALSGGLTEGLVLQGAGALTPFLRLRVTLGGTAPQCRLRLTVTGRDS